MDINRRKLANRELLKLRYQEKELEQAAWKVKSLPLKTLLEKKIPEKVYTGLESAFCTGFSLVFKQGRKIIELTFKKEEMQRQHALRDWKVKTAGSRRELKQMGQSAGKSDTVNLTATTVEGIALGALGIGLPDIVLFLGNLLKGVYETALNYGFDYESRQEQLLILKMMQTALSNGESWVQRNAEVDEMLAQENVDITDDQFKQQLKDTASAFTMDMLLLKFIQGLPIVGIIGGAANPVYYSKVMKYVQLKYRKRYLLKQNEKNNTTRSN